MHTMPGGWTTRHLLAAAVIATAMGTFACSSGEEDAKTQGVGATTGAVDSSQSGHQNAQVVTSVPELTAKIEDITTTDFLKVVDNVSWTGHTEERQCEDSGCQPTPGHKSTRVRHEAAAGANDLEFASIPPNGVVVSRMQNLGKHKEAVYGLLSGKGDYFVILTRASAPDKANLQLANLDYDRDGNPVLDLMPKMWTVVQCEPGHHNSASAGFKDCPSSTTPSPRVVNTFNRGAWFTCSLGCCTTEGVRDAPGRTK